jgi:hypothetical protein
MIILSGEAIAEDTDFSEANLLWRVRADELALSDGDPVVTWEDMTVNGNDWAQATSARRPTFQTNEVNGHAAVQFDTANSQYLDGPDLSGLGLTEADVFIVLKSVSDPHSATSKVGLWLLGDINASFLSLTEWPATDGLIKEGAFYPDGPPNARIQNDFAASLTSWRLYRVTAKTGQDGGVSNNYKHYLDGTVGDSRNMSSLSFGATTHLGRAVWSSGASTSHWDGMVAEFFCFSQRVESTQYDTIKDYINDYYGLSVS